MREIKFRAWDADNNEMVYSDKEDCFYINTKGALFMYSKKPTKEKAEDYHRDYDLMQFTGLKDKNGVEIYEGDIISQHCEWSGGYNSEESGEFETNGVVAIRPSMGVIINKGMDLDLLDGDGKYKKAPPRNVRGYRSEVIGNKYENPELLESNNE